MARRGQSVNQGRHSMVAHHDDDDDQSADHQTAGQMTLFGWRHTDRHRLKAYTQPWFDVGWKWWWWNQWLPKYATSEELLAVDYLLIVRELRYGCKRNLKVVSGRCQGSAFHPVYETYQDDILYSRRYYESEWYLPVRISLSVFFFICPISLSLYIWSRNRFRWINIWLNRHSVHI